ncbi:outer membrane lipoprotein carrier protein LolA [Streptomyces sp. I4(2020)]|uniref:LolA family protein n=1 Tax=Streptomyces sp. I4(2020) TaxID=2760981 RepID=UPI0018EE9139|nr:outer membrane lipoprotein carrier protein LolA [Streptomyces sp. I4(2020)]MBJ6615292.1 outer membrane lipoprotein carrier protein LolA [Streptomyces sp. I3(2020)]MBJ6625745.1 outer membrane lipoprotein carrier protein LolA [Streptomyces sp. I4(2020)]
MAPYESDDTTTAGEVEEPRAGRRKAARYVVPVTVMGVAAATIGLVPALADSGDPDLPDITAAQLIDKIAQSDVERLSGTVKITTDLGLPNLGGLESGLLSGATGGEDGEGGSSADPSGRLTELASGTHTLRVAADGPDRQKLSLLENAAEYSLIHNGKDVWGYDSASNEVYHATVDEAEAEERSAQQPPATPKDFAEEALKAVDDTTSVKVDGTAQVAGRDAYRLVVEPKQSGSTVGAVSIAVDSETGMPLKFTLTPSSGGSAVVDIGFTKVSFDRPDASTFEFTPPKGAKVTEDTEQDRGHGDFGGKPERGPKSEEDLAKGFDGLRMLGEGWNSIATFDTGAGAGLPTEEEVGGDLGGFLGSLGDQVKGDFGQGTVFSTRLVNALITEDGKVYVGTVTKDALVKAAEAGK